MDKAVVYISIGSNMGDREGNCTRGVDAVGQLPSTTVLQSSMYYKTEPVDYTDQDWFVNAAFKIETALDPPSLLKALKQIEHDLGTVDKIVRFGPRTLDLDILLYDGLILNTELLEIPHPRMHERCFVLRPLCDMAPELVHPVSGLRMEKLLSRVDLDGQAVEPL